LAQSEHLISLRKLLRNERGRFWIGLFLAIALPAPFAYLGILAFIGGFIMSGEAGGLVCAAVSFAVIILPPAIFILRFFRFSSTRGLPARLCRYGRLDEIIDRIEDEMGNPTAFFLGQAADAFTSPEPDCVYITENWLVRLCPGGSAVVHLPDLAWVYRRLIVRSAFLSHGRYEDELACVTRNGEAIVFDTWSPLRTEQVVEAVLERRPEVLTGYIGDWVELATKPDSMWVEVQSRRERVAGLSPKARDEWISERWDDCQRYILRQDRQAGAN
jgi:hypothetical protein